MLPTRYFSFSGKTPNDLELNAQPPPECKKIDENATAEPHNLADKSSLLANQQQSVVGVRVKTAIDAKERLSEEASEARKSMLRMGTDFSKFRGILLGIQNMEHEHVTQLKQTESDIKAQQELIRRHADRPDSSDDDEVNCVAIDDASAKIRELQAIKTEVRAKLKQCEVDREELEGSLSSHHNEVTQALAKAQDWVQGQREQKRYQSGASKRNAFGFMKAQDQRQQTFQVQGDPSAVDATSSSRLPVQTPAHPITARGLSSAEIVPSSSRSSLGSSLDYPDSDMD